MKVKWRNCAPKAHTFQKKLKNPFRWIDFFNIYLQVSLIPFQVENKVILSPHRETEATPSGNEFNKNTVSATLLPPVSDTSCNASHVTLLKDRHPLNWFQISSPPATCKIRCGIVSRNSPWKKVLTWNVPLSLMHLSFSHPPYLSFRVRIGDASHILASGHCWSTEITEATGRCSAQPLNGEIFDMVLVLACGLMCGIISPSSVCSALDLSCFSEETRREREKERESERVRERKWSEALILRAERKHTYKKKQII